MEPITADVAELAAAATLLATKDAAGRKLNASGIPQGSDELMDKTFEAIPAHLKEQHGLSAGKKRAADGKFAPKAETPAEVETPPEEETPPGDEEAEPAKAEAATEDAEAKAARLEKREAALKAVRLLPGVPSAVIDALTDDQLLEWGAKATAAHAKTAEKLQKQAEALKAQETKSKPTETKVEETPLVVPELDAALQALSEYGDDFKKAQGTISNATAKAAVERVRSEFQPAVQMLSETLEVVNEMLTDNLRREFDGMFPELDGKDAAFDKTMQAYKRLWGDGGATYQDAASTRLGRVRACFKDACKLGVDQPAPARKDTSRRQAQGLPSLPARQMPTKAKNLDEQMDDIADEVAKRWKL